MVKPKSGVQGLSFAQQQKIERAIQRGRDNDTGLEFWEKDMLSREGRLKLNAFLLKKSVLSDKIEHNKKDIQNQKKEWLAETSEKVARARQAHIKRCEGVLSVQKTKLLEYSPTRLAKITGISYKLVKHQESLFNRSEVIL